MGSGELFVLNLRYQVRCLQSLINYLESREAVEQQELSYSQARLREVVERLDELSRLLAHVAKPLRAEWLN